jgi:prepilin-type N-terminal cleavage/methylation domain-containing protein
MKLNKKGFTLVELLAVIVVLAIIMIIAIPSVMTAMNNAKKGAFKIEAQKVLTNAQSVYESDEMMNDVKGTAITITNLSGYTKGYCYSLDSLGMTNTGTYKGYAIVAINDNDNSPLYYVTLSDKSFSVRHRLYKDLDTSSNISTNKINVDADQYDVTLACPTVAASAAPGTLPTADLSVTATK